jgi:hypothetical protein
MPILKAASEIKNKDPLVKAVFRLAEQRGIGTAELSERSGVSAAALVTWKNGRSPNLASLRDVAKVVGLRIMAEVDDKKRGK